MADATLTLDAEIDTSDFDNGTKDIIKALEDIEFAIRETDGSLNDIGDATGTASSKFGKFGAAAGAVGGLVSSGIGMALDTIGDLTGDIVEASDSADKFRSTLEFSGLDTSTIDTLTESTQAYADQTVYSISDIRNVTAQLAANGVQGFDKLAEAAGNLNAVAYGNAETFGSVGMVLTQTAGAGKLTTENWNQLADAIPGASGKLQEAMLKNGAYTGNFREAMENGEISAEEFNQAIMDLGMTDAAKEAATSTATIEGAMGNLEASIVGVGTTILDQFKGPLTSGISLVAQGISGLSGVFTGLVQTMGPIFSQIGTLFTTAFQPAGDMLQYVWMPALTQLGTALTNLGQAVMPIIMSAIQNIIPVLTQIVSSVMTTVTVISNTVSPVINSISQLIQAALPIIQTAFGIFSQYVQNSIGTAFTYIQNVVSSVMPVIQSIIETVTALISGDWEGVWEGIQNIIYSVWEAIKGIAQAGIDYVKSTVENILNAIKSIFESIWNAIKGTVQDVWNDIKGAVSGAWSGINSAVSNGVSSMMNFITSIPSKIMGVFSGAGSWLLSAGKNIIQGLINGITNAIGGAISAVKDAVGGIIDGAKSLLGIHSPSRVFDREIGRMIPAGLGRGVSENEHAATRPVEDMVNSLLPSSIVTPMPVISNPVNLAGTGGPRVSAPITVNALDPNAAAQETVRVINFHYV